MAIKLKMAHKVKIGLLSAFMFTIIIFSYGVYLAKTAYDNFMAHDLLFEREFMLSEANYSLAIMRSQVSILCIEYLRGKKLSDSIIQEIKSSTEEIREKITAFAQEKNRLKKEKKLVAQLALSLLIFSISIKNLPIDLFGGARRELVNLLQ